jgi:hypothetical protein
VALIRSGAKDVLDARRFSERIRVYGPASHGFQLVDFEVELLGEPEDRP